MEADELLCDVIKGWVGDDVPDPVQKGDVADRESREATPLRGRGFPFPKGKERQQQGLVALLRGRLQVPEAGTEACPALLQATARRCRSAGVTTGRGEPPCCQPFLSHGEGEGHLRFKAKVA